MDISNLTILGTSHISKNSITNVKQIIEDQKPDYVCLELDKQRYFALLQNLKSKVSIRDIRRLGIKGYLFASIGSYLQKKLGNHIGTIPGGEMKKAIDLAKEYEIKIHLIDQDINITLKNFSKAWGIKETFSLIFEIFFGWMRKRKVNFNLKEVPSEEVIDELIKEVKLRFPGVHRALIQDRNLFMARKLAKLMKAFPEAKVFAVVGAGHKKEMIRILEQNFE